MRMSLLRFAKRPLIYFLILFQFTGCATNLHRVERSSLANQDISNEIALGKQIHGLIVSKIPVCNNEQVIDYVREIGTSLARFAKRQELEYQFIVLQDDRIYATSAPGGFVYITTGFLLFLNNESELAYVLAHEIGELQFKNPRLSQTRAIFEKLLKGGALVAPVFGNIGALAMIGFVSIYAITDGDISREKKLYQADAKSLDFMMKANYDPQGAIDVFYKMINATPKELMYLYDFYQTHPVTTTRLGKLESEFSKLKLNNKTFNTNRSHFLAMINPLKPPVLTTA